MALLKKMFSALVSSHEIRARKLVRQELLALPEHRLLDLGFDRAALAAGIDSWPWRMEEEKFVAPATESQPTFTRRELRRAERELRAMSDRELHELGIARTDIRRAVNGDISRVA